jgi:hypothetical protein
MRDFSVRVGLMRTFLAAILLTATASSAFGQAVQSKRPAKVGEEDDIREAVYRDEIQNYCRKGSCFLTLVRDAKGRPGKTIYLDPTDSFMARFRSDPRI